MTLLQRRRPRARATAVAFLSIAGALALAGPATAADPDPKPGKIVADSGFRPATNGYGFPNYGSEPGVVDLGPGQMRRLFGDRVCSSIGSGGSGCTLTPAALEWMNDQNAAMAGGHCFGMATTAQFFFQGYGTPEQPDPFGSPFISRLGFDGNDRLQRHIARAWVTQMLPNVRATFTGGVPSKVVEVLRRTLADGRMPYELVMLDDGDGHAISPYAVNRLKKNRWQLLVYDNNYPGERRAVNLNTKRETWRYQIQPGRVWSGDRKTGTLIVANPRPGIGTNPCVFCKDDPQADDDESNDEAGRKVELRFASPEPGTAETLADFELTRDGRRGAVGLGPDGTYNTLAGADVYQPLTGVLFSDPWENTTYPQTTLDDEGSYDLTVSQPAGSGTARGSAPVAGPEKVTMTGAGYSLSADFAQGIGDSADLSFDPATRSVSFAEGEGVPQDVALGVTTNDAGADYDIDVSAESLPAGTTLVVSVDPGAQEVTISAENDTGGPVDVEVTTTEQSPAGPTTSSEDLDLDGAGTTQTVEY